MNDLDVQAELRALIDGAARPVSSAEAMLHGGSDPHRWPPVLTHRAQSRVAKSVVGVGALVLVSTMIAVLMSPVHRVGPTTPTSSPTRSLRNILPVALVTCIEHPPVSEGCPVTTVEARQMLGLTIPEPGFIPAGWVLGSRTIRGWPAGYFGQATSKSDFNEYWYLPGSGPDSGAAQPMLIELEVHLPSQGTNALSGWQSVQLASGAKATGPLQNDGMSELLWTYQGAGLKVSTYGLSVQETLQFVNGLQFSTP